MGRMKTRSIIALAGLGLALVLTGCSEQGQPKPGASPTIGPTETGSPTTTSTGNSAGGLADLDPCTLLTDSDRVQVGITVAGVSDPVASSPGCKWLVSVQFAARIDFHPKRGLSEINYGNATPTPTTIGKHSGSKLPSGTNGGGRDNGSCQVFIAVDDSSAVAVSISNSGAKNTELACQRADQIAKIIDSKLP